MRFFVLCFCLKIAFLLLSPALLFSQEMSFCTTGIHADGFLDWSQLHAATPGQTTFTQTIPVSGVPGLTAAVTIQKTGPSPVIPPTIPLYGAANSADLSIASIGGTPVTITFNVPVRGVSVAFSAWGRFLHGFHMIANYVNGNPAVIPPPAEIDSSALEEGQDMVYQAPLEIETNSPGVASASLITAVSFGFDGDAYENGIFHLINLRVDSGTQPSASANIPTAGLAAWFRADSTTLSTWEPGGSIPVNTWEDQSGFGRNATVPAAANPPLSFHGGHNCTQVLSFDGTDALSFPLRINGWSGMTILMAAQSYFNGSGSSNAALFWDENAPWGETFVSPFQTSIWYRFGTGEPGNHPSYRLPGIAGGDFQIITAEHDYGTDSLYVNGELAQYMPGRYSLISGTVSNVQIGRGYQNTGFIGNIGEILIYNHALMPTERERVEQYLLRKFGN